MAGKSGGLVVEADSGLSAGTFRRLDREIESVESAGGIPGGVLAIRRGTELVYHRAFGRQCMEPGSARVDENTLFDTASLAKPLAGVPAGLLLVSDRHVGALLSHQVQYGNDVYTDAVDWMREEVRQGSRIAPAQMQDYAGLRIEPVTSDCFGYGNEGYALLSFLLAGHGEGWYRDTVWEPLGIGSFTWTPSGGAPVACTGIDATGEWISGRPYDPLADSMLQLSVAVPLHSGLFATASDVSLFLPALRRSLDPRLMRVSSALMDEIHDMRSCDGRSVIHVTSGGLVSPVHPPFATDLATPGRFLAQTGYTGCLLWHDRRRQISVALLTNATAADAQVEWDRFSRRIIEILLIGAGR